MNKKYQPALFWFAVINAVATFLLIGLGGLVTSKEAGMSVPDWPTTYGYNMFFFPINQWVGGIFLEHSHRLLASGVGLLTTILAVWLWAKDSRKWIHWLGIAAFFAGFFAGDGVAAGAGSGVGETAVWVASGLVFLVAMGVFLEVVRGESADTDNGNTKGEAGRVQRKTVLGVGRLHPMGEVAHLEECVAREV